MGKMKAIWVRPNQCKMGIDSTKPCHFQLNMPFDKGLESIEEMAKSHTNIGVYTDLLDEDPASKEEILKNPKLSRLAINMPDAKGESE